MQPTALDPHISRHRVASSEQLFEAIVRGSGDLIAIAEAVIRFIAGPVAATIGLAPDSLIGLSLFAFVQPADMFRARDAWSQRVSSTESMPPEEY